jgi:LysM repeat protein
MAARGTLFDSGPTACPFVALELDRDRRSERPDYRHRCYAEQVPAPRTIAHQERYCLSPNFSGCPIFQDWAIRAAARPVPLPPGYEGRRSAAETAALGAAGAVAAASMTGSEDVRGVAPFPSAGSAPAPAEHSWPDSMDTALPATGLAAEVAEAQSLGQQQLSAFDAPATAVPPPMDAAMPMEAEPPTYVPPPGYIPPPADAYAASASAPALGGDLEPDLVDEPDAAPVPAFLAGRSSRPRRSPKPDDHVTREDVVPSWDIDGRYGAQAGSERGGDGAFGRILTIVAVLIILALGVAAVVIIPGLLNGTPGQTTRPSFAAIPSGSPGASVVAVVPTPSVGLTIAPPTVVPTTAEPTPAPSPKLYKIKAGDTLAKIARKNGITVQDILDANPQIPDANHIEVGQIIVIPQPTSTPAP